MPDSTTRTPLSAEMIFQQRMLLAVLLVILAGSLGFRIDRLLGQPEAPSAFFADPQTPAALFSAAPGDGSASPATGTARRAVGARNRGFGPGNALLPEAAPTPGLGIAGASGPVPAAALAFASLPGVAAPNPGGGGSFPSFVGLPGGVGSGSPGSSVTPVTPGTPDTGTGTDPGTGVDPGTGTGPGTGPGTTPGTVDPGAPAVPEPSTWLLMILGVGFLGGSMRHQRARAARSFAGHERLPLTA